MRAFGRTGGMVAVTAVLSCSSVAFAGQPKPVEWTQADEIGAADKDAILKLASSLGIDDPHRVTFDQYLPTLCQFVRVESDVVVEGNKRMWRELLLRRRDWPECTKVPRSSKRREGRWIGSSAELSTQTSWRVTDADWFIDVRLGPEVPYGDAEQIVLAIRRRALVNRLPSIGPLKLGTTMASVDPNDVQSIEKKGAERGRYEVRTGRAAGLVLDVVVREGQVELHGQSTWMA